MIMHPHRVDVDAELAKIDEDEDKTKKKGNSVLRNPKKPEVVETLCATGRASVSNKHSFNAADL